MQPTIDTTLLIIGGGPGGYVAAIRAGLSPRFSSTSAMREAVGVPLNGERRRAIA